MGIMSKRRELSGNGRTKETKLVYTLVALILLFIICISWLVSTIQTQVYTYLCGAICIVLKHRKYIHTNTEPQSIA